MERTVSSMPQYNVVVVLPNQFWEKVVNTIALLINRSLSIPFEHIILEKVWRRKEIKLSHLNFFDCITYVYISDQCRNKLNPLSNKCIFIEYGGNEFGYSI